MRSFFMRVLRNVAALLVAYVIFMILAVILFVGVMGALSSKPVVILPEKAVLVLDLNMRVPDSPADLDPITAFLESMDNDSTPIVHLRNVVRGIDAAASDDRIRALLLKGSLLSGDLDSSMANISEIRHAIERFKESGKPVFAYLENTAQRDYYLASVADDIAMHPLCNLAITGIAYQRVYFGEAFEKYGIGVQSAVAGTYKSALETFTRTELSENDRAQGIGLLEDTWEILATSIGESRGLSEARITSISQEIGILDAEEALDAGLIDGIAYLDELIGQMKAISGEDSNTKSFNQVDFVTYARQVVDEAVPSEDTVAVVYVEGVIVDGQGERSQAGAARISRRLRELRNDEDVRAVVIRINSPGGSVTASEQIQREIELLSESVPVVVSMGGVAASGAYWIAAPASHIVADPSTLTGSIGVFMFIPNIQELAGNWGITFDSVETSPFANLFSVATPRGPAQMQQLQLMVQDVYGTFLSRVADGRNMTPEQVRQVAEGRVWTGVDAVSIQLVDELGGLETAIHRAAELAHLEDFRVREVPAERGFGEILAEVFDAGASALGGRATHPVFREVKAVSDGLSEWNDPRGFYSRLPFRQRLAW